MKAIIVDDEKNQREALSGLLTTYCPYLQVIGEAEGVESAFDLIRSHSPDLVFLDVNMQDGTGFDLLKKFEKINFEIIFVTGFGNYALQAFEFNALHFIQKPINDLKLVAAVGKAQQKIQSKQQMDQYKVLLDNLDRRHNSPDNRIAVPIADGMEFIRVADILRCESDAGNTSLYTKDGKRIYTTRHLKEYERLLEDYGFLRIHNSHLINPGCIKSYHRNDGGSVVMSDSSRIPISRRRKDSFLDALKDSGLI